MSIKTGEIYKCKKTGLAESKITEGYNSSLSNLRGVADFGNVGQFNYYEGGYSFLFIIKTPTFLDALADNCNDPLVGARYKNFNNIWSAYKHILEYEFKGLDGLDNITSDTLEVSDGIGTMNLVNKVTQQSASTVSMRYTERSGSIITKVHEAFLKGIRDTRTQVKTYLGMLELANKGGGSGTNITHLDYPSFEHEVFTFLYVVTDNTYKNIERAFLLVGAQPTSAQFDIYNSEKGTIETKDITVEFNCFPIENKNVNEIALRLMRALHSASEFTVNSDEYKYTYDAETGDRIEDSEPTAMMIK